MSDPSLAENTAPLLDEMSSGERTQRGSIHRAVRLVIWLTGLFLFCFVYFLEDGGWETNSRLDLTAALVNQGTVAIDSYHGNTGDADFYHGHYYSITAPGQGLLAVPVYEAQKAVLAVQGKSPPDPSDLNVQYVVTICTVAVPAILFLLLFFWFLGYFSSSLVNRTLLTLALGLATIIFPFARVIISHVTAAGLLFTSFVLVYIVSRRDTVPARGTQWLLARPGLAAFLAGLSAGLAVLFEYPTIAIAALIGLYAAVRLPPTFLWRAALGGALGLGSVLLYNTAAFGSPLTTGYTGYSVSYGGYYRNGIGGLTWPPQFDALWGMSFSPYRGLFFLSPFLLLAFPGYVLWARRGGIEWLLSLAIPISYFIVIAMYPIWFAGTSVGPRLLTPALPFLTLPIIFALDYLSPWRPSVDVRGLVYGAVSGLLALSLINVWAETIGGTTGYPYAWVMNPLFEHSLPALARGEIASNWGRALFGLTGMSSLLPLLFLLSAWSLIVLTPVTGAVARLQHLAGRP